MIRWFLFLLGFFFGFSLEVRVIAAEQVQLRNITSVAVEEPKGCTKKIAANEKSCAFQVAEKKKFSFEDGHGRNLTIGEKAVLVRKAKSVYRLLDGVVRLQGESTRFETEYGTVFAQGEVFLVRKESEVLIVNTGTHDVQLKGNGWLETQNLSPGYQVELSKPMRSDGQAAVGLPFPFDFEQQTVREARFFDGSKADFAKRLQELVEIRSVILEQAAQLHQSKVERKIASLEADKKKREEMRRAREARDREIRALFRKRVLTVE